MIQALYPFTWVCATCGEIQVTHAPNQLSRSVFNYNTEHWERTKDLHTFCVFCGYRQVPHQLSGEFRAEYFHSFLEYERILDEKKAHDERWITPVLYLIFIVAIASMIFNSLY